MSNALTYIKQKSKTFVIFAAVIEFAIFVLSGLSFLFIQDDLECFIGIVLLVCSLVFPFKLIIDTYHINFKFLWILKILLGLALLIPFFSGNSFQLFSAIMFIAFLIAEIICLDLLKVKNQIAAIVIHSLVLMPPVGMVAAILADMTSELILYMTIAIIALVVLEIVFYAFVYIGTSRWVCPDCHRINKGKAKFCVGCGKVRPEQPKPVRKPRPAPVYAAPAPQPNAVTPPPAAPQPITDAPQPTAAAPQPEGTSFCSECGAPLEPGSVFCGQCGKPLK